MSFSLSVNSPAPEARTQVSADPNTPQSVKDFVLLGIHGLTVRYGPTVQVAISLNGHLFDGDPSSYDVTSVSVNVYKA